MSQIVQALRELGAIVSDMDYDRRLDEKRRVNVTLDARVPISVGIETLVDRLEKQPGVRRVHIIAPA